MMQIASRVVRGARAPWHRLGRDESGSVFAFLAAAAGPGRGRRDRRRDRRALSREAPDAELGRCCGAGRRSIDMHGRQGQHGDRRDRASTRRERNGFTNGVNGVTVTVNRRRRRAPMSRTTGAVEVIITKTTGFSIGAALINGSLGSFAIGATRSAPARYAAQGTTRRPPPAAPRAAWSRSTPDTEPGRELHQLQQLHLRLHGHVERHGDRYGQQRFGQHEQLHQRHDVRDLDARIVDGPEVQQHHRSADRRRTATSTRPATRSIRIPGSAP